MAKENEIHHYINQEQESDRKMLDEAPAPKAIINLTLVAIISVSFALITVFVWAFDFLSTEVALTLVFLTGTIGVACVSAVGAEVRNLRQSIENQIMRKYKYWMPDHAELPVNHPESSIDTTQG